MLTTSKLMGIFARLSTALFLATVGFGSPAFAADMTPPTEDEVIQTFDALMHSDLAFDAVEVSEGREASIPDCNNYYVNLGEPIFPVHVKFTQTTGIYIRDTDTHYMAYRKYGRWVMANDQIPGDIYNELRP